MQTLKESLKRNLPSPIISFLKESNDFAMRIPDWPSATFHKWRRESVERLNELKNLHKGERCFLIGNGPSLKKTDLSRLRSEFTIGVNQFFLAFPELGFKSSYYLTVNDLIAEQSGSEIQALDMPRFVSWRMRKWLKPAPNLSYQMAKMHYENAGRQIIDATIEGKLQVFPKLITIACSRGARQKIITFT